MAVDRTKLLQGRMALEAQRKGARLSPQQAADRAMGLLHTAVRAGFNNAAHMKKDTDLDPLRDRADFKELLESLAKPKR